MGGRMEVYSKGPGHVTKMASIPVCGKNALKIISETRRPIIFELGIQHQGLISYKKNLNDDPRLIMTYFTARSTLLFPNAFIWEKIF